MSDDSMENGSPKEFQFASRLPVNRCMYMDSYVQNTRYHCHVEIQY